jgi:glutathione S-transferase
MRNSASLAQREYWKFLREPRRRPGLHARCGQAALARYTSRMPPVHDYELYYWPGIPGRGEFIRLSFEYAGATYREMTRERSSMTGMFAYLKGKREGALPFAPPFLKHGSLVIAQVANVLLYLAPRLGLVPRSEGARIFAHQLELTVTDVVAEVHDTHHPTSSSKYYEDQKREAKLRAKAFTAERIPKYLGYFEDVLARNDSRHLIGRHRSYVDLSIFQLVAGLRYAFPKAMKRVLPKIPELSKLHDAVANARELAAYFASPRRLPFGEEGIFRRYPELDL